MKKRTLSPQRGLSLVMVAVVMGLLAFVAVLGLVSMRQDKNLFGEIWSSFQKTSAVQQVQQAQQAPAAPIRKCTIDGKVVYSNVECGKEAADSRAVQLHDTRGVEAPKAPPAPPASAAGNAGADLREKAIERAVR
ncbi:MAG TPA: DUF4124 domain-containing protein [Paucimonas sp.]|nr:DUF4124 domain-containing protein [Paucimonas sp.]